MKKHQLAIFLLLCFVSTKLSAQSFTQKWNVKDPFEQKLFIENRGQFDFKPSSEIGRKIGSASVLYGVRTNGVNIYFTTNGVLFHHSETELVTEDEHEANGLLASKQMTTIAREEESEREVEDYYLNMRWMGKNPNVSIAAQDKATNYFTYSDLNDKTGKSTIKANGFKKIVYKNIYPSIDIEYTFPEGKAGIKYAYILHPGADYRKITMNYQDANGIVADENGNLKIASSFGEFIDHAPVSYTNGHKSVNSSFVVNGHNVSFNLGKIDLSKTTIIDPWVSTPTFTGSSKAYDVDWDFIGNVYIYGGQHPFQLSKLNASGIIQWTYTSSAFDSDENDYGDFCVDRNNGNCYLSEAFNNNPGARILKVNTSGVQTAMFPGTSSINEMWNIAFNSCTNKGVIGCGNTNIPNQAATFDANLTTVTPVNILSTTQVFIDIVSLVVDNTDAYFMTSQNGATNFENTLLKCPLPTLVPTAYMVNSGYNIQEVNSIFYTESQVATNSYNGMAKSSTFLYTYDGGTIKKWNPSDCSLVSSVVVSTTPTLCGGIAVDDCDNVFVGTISGVSKYNSSLGFVSSTPTSGEVYDVDIWGLGNEILVAGNGFVSALNLYSICSSNTTFTLDKTTTSSTCLGNDGTATVSVNGGTPPFNYIWSPGGQTTATATGLAPGTYSIIVYQNSASCGNSGTVVDSVTITASSGFTGQSNTSTNISCYGGNNGSATELPIGGAQPYTYLWTPGGQTSQTISNLTAGTYHVTVHDVNGCQTTDSVIVQTASTALSVYPQIHNISCQGYDGYIQLQINGGTAPYNIQWSNGESTDFINVSTPGNYSVTVTDALSCSVNLNNLTVDSPQLLWQISDIDVTNTCGDNNNGAIAIHFDNASLYYLSFNWYDSLNNYIPGDSVVMNLTPGVYNCEVYDDNFCKDTTFQVVVGFLALVSTQNNYSCGAANSGTITATLTGGAAPYNYLWSNGQTTQTVTGLSAGTYTVTVTDNVGCITTATSTLAPFSATYIVQSYDCYNSYGYINLIIQGGTPPYNTFWSTGETTQNIYFNHPGQYSVVIQDANGCSQPLNINISSTPTIWEVTSVTVSNACGSNNGAATVHLSNSQLGFYFQWQDQNFNYISGDSLVTGLSPGVYYCQIYDYNYCQDTTIQVNIVSGASFSTNTTSTNANCGNDNGTATATPVGGTSPITYLWSNGQTTQTATGLAAGNYTVTVSDGSGCQSVSNVTINSTSALTVSISTTGGSNVITSNCTNCTSFQWYRNDTLIPGATSMNYTITKSGSYYVVVSDGNNCTGTSNILELTYTVSINEEEGTSFNIYPNPSNGSFIIEANITHTENLNLKIHNTIGQLVYKEDYPKLNGYVKIPITLEESAMGVYFVKLQFGSAVITKRIMVK